MDSVDTFSHHFSTQNAQFCPVVHLQKRNLSPKQEKESLIKKIEVLMAKNITLEEKKENLKGTIYDLRKLLAVVGKEGAEEAAYLHQRNAGLKKEEERLSKALKYSYKEGKHLQKCAMYWGQFLQQ